MKKMIAALLIALSLAVGAGVANAQPPATQVFWGCTIYLFGLRADYQVVTTDGGYPDVDLGWPYSVWCAYLGQCDTVFDGGVYTTTCH